MGIAKIYVDSLPIEIKNAHRIVYLPDSSVHVLDQYDRPLFTAPPGTRVVVMMDYSLDTEPDPRQIAHFARPRNPRPVQKDPIPPHQAQFVDPNPTATYVAERPPAPAPHNATDATQPIPVVDSRPNTQVGNSRAAERPEPGTIQVGTLRDAHDATGEVVMPDFLVAPTSASGETRKTPAPGAAAD